MWEKIVLNLLSNAFKFTFEGEIEVSLQQAGDWIELRVRDTGIGVDPTEVPRLFERFYRIEGTRSRTYEGSGIGLALVRELVKLHGGQIDVESVVGEGTTFTIRLKRGHHHLPASQIGTTPTRTFAGTHATAFVEEAAGWLPDPPDAEPESDAVRDGSLANRGRILVADDNADMRDYVTRLLSERWAVEAVPDGIAALARMREQSFDLVLADVMMPGLDGFELLKAVRADPATASTPFIMLSARAGEEARIVGLQAGADEYLIKPFSGRELEARVGAQLEAGRLRRALERERQRLYALFQQSPVAIVVLEGASHRVVFANSRYSDLSGHSNADLLHRPLVEADPALAGSVLLETIDFVFATGETAHQPELEIIANREGAHQNLTRYFDWTCQATHGTDGRVDGTVQFFYDVTDKVLSRDAVTAAGRTAESANRAKDEFLAMLGHELRNPLAPIVTALELMRMRGGDVARAGHHRTAGRTCRAARRRSPRRLPHCARKDSTGETANGAGDARLPGHRDGQPAVRAAPPVSGGGRSAGRSGCERGPRSDVAGHCQSVDQCLEIQQRRLSSDGYGSCRRGIVRLRVRDEGVGIAPDMLSCVFDMFVQHRQSTDRAAGGLGLGLTIVKNLVEMHGGAVSVRSDGPGKGSEFSIELALALPAVEVLKPELAPVLGQLADARGDESSSSTTTMTRRRC